jgi:hypothetical protein
VLFVVVLFVWFVAVDVFVGGLVVFTNGVVLFVEVV